MAKKKSIQVLREAQGHAGADPKCWHCMDTGLCDVCKGAGYLSTRGGALTICGYCRGARKCPYCQPEPQAA
jgi:hypothetical protein